jgi:DNA replicative helicase MCM subunit Mcm2 (Cdc46/Mcm family)
MSDLYSTTKEKAHIHDTTMPLLKAMYSEFKELSRKKPDSAVSKSKIKITNRLLEKVRTVLEDSSSIEFLDLLEEDDIPQVSDVTLILSQYVASMEAFHKRHYGYHNSEHQWVIK